MIVRASQLAARDAAGLPGTIFLPYGSRIASLRGFLPNLCGIGGLVLRDDGLRRHGITRGFLRTGQITRDRKDIRTRFARWSLRN